MLQEQVLQKLPELQQCERSALTFGAVTLEWQCGPGHRGGNTGERGDRPSKQLSRGGFWVDGREGGALQSIIGDKKLKASCFVVTMLHVSCNSVSLC